MPDKIENKDIEFQPPVKSYAYTSSNPIPKSQITINPVPKNPSAKKISGKILNTILTLVFSVLGFLFLFFIFLAILNYFNVISLNNFSPAFNNLPKSQLTKEEFLKRITPKEEPKPHNISGTNQFTIDGALEKYDQNSVYIKFFKKTITIEYDYDSKFYYTKTFMNTEDATPSAETIAIIDFPSNILKQENIGKKVTAQFIKENNKIILIQLIFY